MEVLEGTVERVTYHDEDSGYTVARLSQEELEQDLLTVVGHFEKIHPGETYQLRGSWVKHPRYGRQFQVNTYAIQVPSTLEGIERYLGSGLIKGIGPSLSKRIVAAFGLQTLEVFDKEPEKLKKIHGIGEQKFKKLVSSWQDQKQVKDLVMFFQEHGLSQGLALRVFKKFKNRSLDIVQNNPYELVKSMHGVGFQTADRMALLCGFSENHPKRLEAALVYCVEQALNNGNTFILKAELFEKAQELIKVEAEEALKEILDELLLKDELREHFEEHIYTPWALRAEKGLAKRVKELREAEIQVDESHLQEWLEGFQRETKFEFSEEQIAAFKGAVKSSFFILTGGPGTGKTTATQLIVKYFLEQKKEIACASPTGRAAQRLSEVVGEKASTLHRLLEFDPSQGGFRRDESNPLEMDVLLVDEASMVDLWMAFSLFRAVGQKTQVILVGDADQLPSVGPGDILRDLLGDPENASVELKKIFRQASESQLIQGAHCIRKGDLPSEVFEKNPKNELKDFYWMEEVEPFTIKQKLVDLVLSHIPRRFQLDPRKDVQILTLMNRGELGVHQLNVLFQEKLNPLDGHKSETTRGESLFREGDRIIQRVNNYDKQVFNGDLGEIDKIDSEEQVLLVRFGDRVLEYEFSELNEISLAYAISVHKSQGSEFPCVLIPVHKQHYMLLSRHILYTGLTRAKKLGIMLGDTKAFRLALSRSESQKRNTSLLRFLKGDENER
jgi:exodeoxyribonuclease V alpha subunit